VADLLTRLATHARERPTQQALVDPAGRALTWAELDDLVRRAAGGLTTRARPGQGVLIGAFEGAAPVVAHLAAQAAGLVPVVVGPGAGPVLGALVGELDVAVALVGRELAAAARATGVECVAVDDRGAADVLSDVLGEPVAPTVAERDPARVAAVQFSTGSTGTPKGIVRTVGAEHADALGRCLSMGVRERDTWLSLSSTNTNIAIGALRCVLLVGGRLTLTAGTDPTALESATRPGVEVLALQPHDWRRALDHGLVTTLVDRGLRIAVMTGGHGDARTLAALEQALGERGDVLNIYGLTEAGNVAVSTGRSRRDAGATHVGVPTPLLDVAVVGERGEVRVRGEAVAGTYLVAAVDGGLERVDALVDGWLPTGDLGSLDGAGGLDLWGRIRDLLPTAAGRLVPREAELAVTSATGLPECVVLPPVAGEARLVLPVPALDVDLLAGVRRALAAHPALWEVVACAELPRNHGGKTDRARLSELTGADPGTHLDLRATPKP
jgi:acyl-CoA synthetase (AMP-forming)/AMP-acid ligase II